MKAGLGGKIIKEFVRLRAKFPSYLKDHGGEDKKSKGTKKCVTKKKLQFENYKNYLKPTQLENKIIYSEKNKIDIDSLKKIKTIQKK